MSQKIIPPKSGFTDTFINKLKHQDKVYEVSDYGAKGLRLRVTTTGNKIFLTSIRIKGKLCQMTLGHYPVMTLAEARSELLNRKQKNCKGELLTDREKQAKEIQHKQEKEARNIITGVVMQEFVDRVISTRRTAATVESRIKCNIYGGDNCKIQPVIVLANIPIRDVMQNDVTRLIYSVIDRGSPVLAKELLAVLKQFFKWATIRGYINSSPIEMLRKSDLGIKASVKPDFPLDIDQEDKPVSGLPEIKRFFSILDYYPLEVRNSLKILILTGVRSIELRKAEPSHIDLNAMTWFIPAEHTKTLSSITIPLSEYTASLLSELLEDGRNHLEEKRLSHQCRRIVKEHGFRYFTPHTARKTLRSHIIHWCQYHVAEKCLNHSLGSISSVYDKASLIDERRKALQIWSDNIERAVYGSDTDNVFPLIAVGN